MTTKKQTFKHRTISGQIARAVIEYQSTPAIKTTYYCTLLNQANCSAQCWSFMQCCSGNFLMNSWHKYAILTT